MQTFSTLKATFYSPAFLYHPVLPASIHYEMAERFPDVLQFTPEDTRASYHWLSKAFPLFDASAAFT